ncbi:hypothetical protein FACS1894187_10440 [Synergistales bacterium]|nr:hypothetical protein FACS1894187_10440 [Synergistales bacterium]
MKLIKILVLIVFWPFTLIFYTVKLLSGKKVKTKNGYYYNIKTPIEKRDYEYPASLDDDMLCRRAYDDMKKAIKIGSKHYIWQTAEDGIVRPSHRKMNKKIVAWDNPPIIDGIPTHAGMIKGCRCIAMPLLPEDCGLSYAEQMKM